MVDPLLVSFGELTEGSLTAGGVEAGGGDVWVDVAEPVVWLGTGAGGETGTVVVVCAVDCEGVVDGLFNPKNTAPMIATMAIANRAIRPPPAEPSANSVSACISLSKRAARRRRSSSFVVSDPYGSFFLTAIVVSSNCLPY